MRTNRICTALGLAGLLLLVGLRSDAKTCGSGTSTIQGTNTSTGNCSEINVTNKRLQTDAVVTGLVQLAGTASAAFAATTADTDLVVATTSLRLLGYTIRESKGVAAVATAVLRHNSGAGNCNSGDVIAYIELAADKSASGTYGDRGLGVPLGVCVDILTGEVDLGIETVTEASTLIAVASLPTEDTAQTTDFDLMPATASLRLLGYTIRESAAGAAVATVVLRHDVAAGGCSGAPFAYIELAANTSQTVWLGDRGIAAASGICADVLAGEVDAQAFKVVE